MAAPIIIRNPVFLVQPLDAPGGTPTGLPVDLSDDVSAVTLEPDIAIDTVSTFTGKFRVADDAEWSASVAVKVGPDTSSNWAALIGDPIQIRIFDRGPATTGAKYRYFESEILIDPSLGGATDVEERVRQFDMDMPVYSTPAWGTVT